MATAADKSQAANADAAAEKAYADAASALPAKKVDEVPPSSKIDAALAAVKAAPKKPAAKKGPVRKAKKSALKKSVSKAAVAKKSTAGLAPKKNPKKTVTTTRNPAPRADAVTQMKDKIMATAKTTTTDYTAKAKEFAADAQTRAKAAYDKLQAYAGEMTEFTKGNVEAVVESGKILGAGMQDMARGEVEAAKGAFETMTADLKAMAAVKSPTELFKLQGEIARRNFDAAVARYSKNAETSMKLANDAFAPLSNRMSLAAEKVATTAA